MFENLPNNCIIQGRAQVDHCVLQHLAIDTCTHVAFHLLLLTCLVLMMAVSSDHGFKTSDTVRCDGLLLLIDSRMHCTASAADGRRPGSNAKQASCKSEMACGQL